MLVFLASAGIDGALTLFDSSIIASANMSPSTKATEPNTAIVNYALTFKNRSTHGTVTAWYDLPFASKKSKVLAKWTGKNTTYNLGSGSFKLKAAPVIVLR